jgi:MFS family permease
MEERWLRAWGVGSASFGAASVLAPLYAVSLGADAAALGVLAAVAALAGAPGAVVVGRYADRTGRRRPVVVVALLVAAFGLAATPFVGTVAGVVALNGVVWFASAAAAPVVTMLVVDRAPEAEWNRRIGVLNAYQGWGWAAGLVAGTVWTAAGATVGSRFAADGTRLAQESLFCAAALLTLGAAALCAYRLPADEPAALTPAAARRVRRSVFEGARGFRAGYLALAPARLYWATRSASPRTLARRFSPGLAAYFGAAALFLAGFQVFWAPLPAFLTSAGLGSEAVFGLYLVNSLASAALYARVGEASARFDPRRLQAAALGARALAFPMVAVAAGVAATATFGAVAAVLGVVGATWAVIAVTASAVVTALAPHELRGEALGVYTALTSLAGGVGSVLGGWLGTHSYPLTFAVAGGLVAAGALLVVARR